MTITTHTSISLEVETCITCGVMFGLPYPMHQKLRENRNEFYCPNGHGQHFIAETEAEKLRKELKRKEQELADEAIRKIQTQNELDKANRKLKRVHNGTCPCCNRSFKDLQRHIRTKHPELIKK